MTERTREIGLRKAVGAKRRDILWQFLTEAVILSSVGGLIGLALGAAGAYLISGLSDTLDATVAWNSVILAILFSAAVGLFFGIYPATRAAGLNPIDCVMSHDVREKPADGCRRLLVDSAKEVFQGMKFIENIRIAFRGLSANKLRAALTMLGIMIGVAAVITLLALGDGVTRFVADQFSGLGTNLVFIIPEQGEPGPPGSDTLTESSMTLRDAELLADVNLVPQASRPSRRCCSGSLTSSTAVTSIAVLARASTPTYAAINNLEIARGRDIDEGLRRPLAGHRPRPGHSPGHLPRRHRPPRPGRARQRHQLPGHRPSDRERGQRHRRQPGRHRPSSR